MSQQPSQQPDRLAQITHRFAELARLGSSNEATTKPTLAFIAVSDDVWFSLHRRFDSGSTGVYTGRKDGTDRPVIRTADDRIVAVLCGREVVPLTVVKGVFAPQSGHLIEQSRLHIVKNTAINAGRDDKLVWDYSEDGEFRGGWCDGTYFTKSELNETTN